MNQINQRYVLVGIVSITVFVLLGVAIWKIPQMQVASLKEQIYLLNILRNLGTSIDLKDLAKLEKLRIDAENAARTVIVQGVGGSFVFLTAFVAFLNYRETRRNVTIAEEKQVTERFSKAIEQLGNASIHVRLGAIYALERIAKDSEKDYWQVMEILTAYVRENAPYPLKEKRQSLLDIYTRERNTDPEDIPCASTDIQAVFKVLSRRDKTYKRHEEYGLDLSNSNLREAKFDEIRLNNANLCGAYLKEAYLNGAKLNDANLISANLICARLRDASLVQAYLVAANFSNAILWDADLSGVNLSNAILRSADLRGANLSNAILWYANLGSANLGSANLSGADLSGAIFSDANFQKSVYNNETKLPKSFDPTEQGMYLIAPGANLSDADLRFTNGLAPEQVKEAQNWEEAIYDEEFRAQLGLPPEPSK